MAIELLVRAINNTPHSGIDPGHFWKEGEIVVVKQSPAVWGREEDPATSTDKDFWIITAEGVDIDDPRVPLFLERGVNDGTPEAPVPRSRRRRWYNKQNLPGNIRNQLTNTGRLTIPANLVNDYLDTVVEER